VNSLAKFANRILFLSPELEAEGLKLQSRSNLLDALDGFEQLAQSVSASIEPACEPASEPKAVPSASAPAPLPAQKTAQYTAKKEYQPALSNQGLINALLEYHRKSSPRRSAILRPGEDTSFVSAKVPEVEAEVKDARGFSRSPGLAYPILRSR
jgi:hypothetical protein